MADPRNHPLDQCMCGDYRRDHEQGGSGRCKFSGLGHSDGHGGAGRCDRFRLSKKYEEGDYIPAGFDLEAVEK